MSIIAPLNLDKFIDDLNLREIKSPAILSSKGKYDPDGLFSESVFGLDRSNERRTTYAFINLNTRVIHPFIYEVFKKIERKVLELIDGETYYFNHEDKTISKDFIEGYKEISGFDGAMYAINNGLALRGDTEVRDKIIIHLEETIKNKTAFIDKLLIVPPDFRPAQIAEDGSLMGVDDLNSFYIKIINLSKKIKMTDNNDNTGEMSDSSLIRKDIQRLVNDVYNYGKLKIGKKSGLNRSNLLGKRVDFSARTVVTGGPELPIGVLGVPYRILANIFQPFMIHFFTKEFQPGSEHYDEFMKILERNDFELSLNTLVITNFLSDLSDDAIKMSKEDEEFIIELFQRILDDKYVVMKRDPALHKGSWQSFKIRVIGEVAVRVPISQTSLFNMDFDGDCLSGFVKVFIQSKPTNEKGDMKSEILHISEFVNRPDLFTHDSTDKNVDKYKPLKDIFIDAISLEDGTVDRKKITEYSVHRNLKMLSIEDAFDDRFEKFWVSDDHSVIVFDELEGCYLKIKPEDILEAPYRFSLVQLKDGEKVFISCEEVSIKEDKDKTEAFDFTVEDYYTFSTHDGIFVQDTAAIFAPLTLEAQEDCAKLMHIPTGTKNIMQSSIEIKHEIILVAYILTDVSKLKNKDIGIMNIKEVYEKRFELGIKNHAHETMTIVLHNNKKLKTSIGRAIFNSVFPKEFLSKYYNGFIEETITSKFANNSIIQNLYSEYEAQDASLVIDDLIKVLRFYVSVYPSSLVLEEFLNSKKFAKLKERLSKAKSFPEKQKIIDEIDNVLKNDIDKDMPMINEIIKSGSRGNTNQLRQMLVSKGILQDAQGNMLFIDESYVDGLSPVSTFMGGYGGRKGIMDRSRQTATTGYLFRKLIYAMASVMYNEDVDDCKTKNTVLCKVTKKNSIMLRDRFIIDDKKKKVKLTTEELKKRVGQTVNLRSPIYCKTHRICKTCYGDLMSFYHSIFIGIIAAQTMGERGSQEMMKTFHTGGSSDVQIPDLLVQIVNNNPSIDVPHLKKYFVQDGMKLKFKNDIDIKLILRQEDYFNMGITSFTVIDEEKSDIIMENMDIDGTKLKRAMFFKPLSMTLEVYKNEEKIDEFDIIVDDGVFMPIDPFEPKEYRDDDGVKIIELKTNTKELDYFMIVELSSSDMNVKMQTILGILEKKNIIKHPEVAFNKLTKIYGDDFGIAYNHIEILISQIFRNKAKPEYPARLFEPYDAKVYSIKNISHLESFLSGLLFENISKSLQSGFINDSTIQNPLEKLLSDDFDF